MAIEGFLEEKFDETLYKFLSPSEPIDKKEFLHGRELELEKAIDSLKTPSKHLFIYGDRGVGKSSLAQTTAYLYQSSDNVPIKIECEEETKFYDVIEFIAGETINKPSANIESIHKVRLSAKLLSYEYTHKKRPLNKQVPTVDSMIDAVSVLEDVVALHSQKPVIIIDEFDTISSYEEKKKFSTLIKHLSDKKIRIKFIFTGIASSLKDLVGAHKSSPRQIGQLHLNKLHWEARFEIIDDVASAFMIEVPDDVGFRIAGISDGFPSYIHLICEKIFRILFKKDEVVVSISIEDYYNGIRDAINDINETLREPYEKATMRDTDDYHHVLWALADAYDPDRHFKNIYSSYEAICREINKAPIDKKTFSTRIASLKKDSYGSVIVSVANRPKWYKYGESMLRGYARLVAECNGLTLNYELYDSPVTLTAMAKESVSSYSYANKGLENKIKFRSERKYRIDNHVDCLTISKKQD